MTDNVETLQMRHVCSQSPHKKHKSVPRVEVVQSTLYQVIPTPLTDVSFAQHFVNCLAPMTTCKSTNNIKCENTVRIATSGGAKKGFTVALTALANGTKLPAYVVFKEGRLARIPQE